MRILFFDQYFKTPAMIGGTRTYEMARRWVAGGHTVDVVTTWRASRERRTPFDTVEAGISVHWIPIPYDNRMSFGQRIRSFASFALRSSAVRGRGAYDVVVATSTPLTIAIPGVLAARRLRVPFVFEVRDLWPEIPIAIGALRSPALRAAARRLEHWAYRNAWAIVALSPGMKAGVVSTGFDPTRIAIVPNASDIDLFDVPHDRGQAFRASRPWLGDRPLLVYAGTLGKVNGVTALVDLAVELHGVDPEIRVLIVGDGADLASLRQRAMERRVLGVNLFIEPPVSKTGVADVLAAADMAACLVVDLPELRANSANKFFDALASGTPVLVNYGGWHDDLVRNHGIGMSVWRMEPPLAAREVALHLRDRRWCSTAGAAARSVARRWFDRDLLAERLEAVLVAAASRDTEALARIAGASALGLRESEERPVGRTQQPLAMRSETAQDE